MDVEPLIHRVEKSNHLNLGGYANNVNATDD